MVIPEKLRHLFAAPPCLPARAFVTALAVTPGTRAA